MTGARAGTAPGDIWHDGIRQTTHHGVRTVLAPRPGPVTAGLFFRVGCADETLASRGITHLVEHLALHERGLGEGHYNGATAASYTHFHTQGTEPEVVAHLNAVCAALAGLPLQRVEIEKEILRTEEAGRGGGANRMLPLWRYGARGYGLVSYKEVGLPRLDAAQVHSWAATWFTRENAVLWITAAEVPADLDLTPLATGTWYATPAITSALPETPAYFPGEDGVVVLDAVVPRASAGTLYAELLGRELFRELRQRDGLSYTATADYSPLNADQATVIALADALPDKQGAVLGGFIDVLAKMRAPGRITQADLDTVRDSTRQIFDIPDVDAARLPSLALSLLYGHRSLTRAQLRAELDAVTLADIRTVAEQVRRSALLQVPSGCEAEWAGFTPAPLHSDSALPGNRHPALREEGVELVIGPQGVSLITPHGVATVRYDQCVLMSAVPDGARRLTGEDGMVVAIEPTLFRITPGDMAAIDRAVPAQVVVEQPPRAPEDIPRPAAEPAKQGVGRFLRRK